MLWLGRIQNIAHVRVRFDWAHQRNGSKKFGFPDAPGCRKMLILVIFWWDLGSGKVRNRLEMDVGFKWTDSQLISSHMSSFSYIFMISIVMLPFPLVWHCFRKVPGPSESALRAPGPSETISWWSDVASGRSQDSPRVFSRSRDPVRLSCPTGRNLSGLVWTCRD